MEWLEVKCKAGHEAAELISNAFLELGAGGTVVDDPRLLNEYLESKIWDYTDLQPIADDSKVVITAYLPADADKKAVGAAIAALGYDFELTIAKVEDTDWENQWKEYFHTTKVGKKLVIKPSWEEYEPKDGEIVLAIDPGAAFGTGTHATTTMCLEFLEELGVSGKTVFDVGTGSGILTIAAAKLGAAAITASDYDPSVIHIAKDNIAAAGVMANVIESDLLSSYSGTADLIIANIIPDIIIRLFDEVDAYLNAGGVILTSGIILEREADVTRKATSSGFKLIGRREKAGWVALVFARQN